MAPSSSTPAFSQPWQGNRLLMSFSRRQDTSSHSGFDWRKSASPEDLVLESWSQGVVVGSLMIMACITIANMRRGVLLHKLILAELLLAMSHGTFCFMSFDGYGWYLSSTAMLLYMSWIIHNIVAWLKVRPFFSHPGGFFSERLSFWTTRIYLGTLMLSLPVIVFQASNNFRFFNNRGGYYRSVRPWEPFMRDPWWVFTCIALFHVIRKCYGTGTLELLRRSPRFGILLSAIFLSMVFTACDIAASVSPTALIGSTEGINPWWKLSLVFKCLTDTIMLDDFKTELRRLGINRINKEEQRRNTMSLMPEGNTLGMPDAYGAADDELSSQRRKPSRWFGRNSLARASTACDVSPTTSVQKAGATTHESVRGLGTKPLDPDADVDEVEFSTALSLGPPHPSNRPDESQRHVDRKDSLTDTTRRLSRLPNLQQWRFEAIKPGKASKPYADKPSTPRDSG